MSAAIRVTLWPKPRSHLQRQTKQGQQIPTDAHFELVTQDMK